jgi:hypothetical protein
MKPDRSEPDHVEPNQALHRQSFMYKQKKEQSTTVVILTQSTFFVTLSIVLFFKEAYHFGSWLHVRFEAKKHLTWAPYLVEALSEVV